ncbi:autophagy-type protein 9 [Coprinopsis cinerea okayama7|uniref:Autophagy-related protein 9 n=1 Tax=Coprinopsis cinerea (strain Okayama-7 / 130 / ATCC MYA-4618 / FGSC 9003) TaxID=240176 RepID=A8NEF7_COPC7|nr:autophagy-type protein 9 [Coprinopsis cinerea okayama7\|eukprot:XP_001833014.2 autophagy-type protein 9 [Coprinopsis cinerea okayama7\
MFNPMSRSRTYQGYMRADALPEEEDEHGSSGEDIDLESGSSPNAPRQKRSAKSQGKRKVSWDGNASEMNVLRPNIQKDDKKHEGESSEDDEVPQSFMIEATAGAAARQPTRHRGESDSGSSRSAMKRGQPLYSTSARSVPPILPTVAPHVSIPPKPSELDVEEDNMETPRLARGASASGSSNGDSSRQPKPMRGLDEYERALWNWVNVYNLDAFLQEVYMYYEGKGIYSIALSRGLNLLFSGVTLLFFILFTAFYLWQIYSYVMDVLRLVDMYNFYTHLLKIPDSDIQTISWAEVVRRIGAIRQENPITAISSTGSKSKDNNTSTAKLDAHDVANRIMRQENYLIALFNKDLLDLRVPLPGFLNRFVTPEKGKGKVLTQALEWNLRFCLMGYLFDSHGRQYQKDPGSISGRRYTSYAQWKFREFNELPHIFTRRLDESYPLANVYMGQFPNEKMTILMRFVAFIAGSFAAVLLLATLIDPDIFLNFEITPHRTVLFYLGVFGGILTVARGMIPEENRVFDPELLMNEVIAYTHYMPDDWKGELHSKRVNQEFGELFKMKLLIFIQEIVSVVTTPFVLWFSLPDCAPAIVDFFREFTVHVDGRGYVCSFAEFNFERHGNVKFGAPAKAKDNRMISNDGKMEKSFLNFKAANPDWQPTDPSGSLYLNRMANLNANLHQQLSRRRQQQEQAGYAGDRDLSATVHFAPDSYDRALRQSQHAALTRRRGLGNSIMTMSMLNAAGPEGASSVYAGDLLMARTAVLGDSQNSVHLGPSPSRSAQGASNATGETGSSHEAEKEEERSTVHNEIGLGDSYVDGAKRPVKPYVSEGADEEEEELEDGGVLGLLTQIYGRRDGPTVGMP